MSYFIAAQIDVRFISEVKGVDWFMLLRDIEYHVGHKGSGNIIKVPEGFVTDFASIPRFAHFFLDPIGKYSAAAIVHDFLYREKIKGMSRKDKDNIFYEAMIAHEVDKPIAKTMYAAVRIFGSGPYSRAQKGGTIPEITRLAQYLYTHEEK